MLLKTLTILALVASKLILISISSLSSFYVAVLLSYFLGLETETSYHHSIV